MELTVEEQMKIYKYLLGDFELGTAYNSPLPVSIRGSSDKSSSFNIYVSKKNGNVYWKDFGGGGFNGDAYALIMILRKLTFPEAKKFYESRIKINNYISRDSLEQTLSSYSRKRKRKPKVDFTWEYSTWALSYWNKLNITKQELIDNRIYELLGVNWDKVGSQSIESEKGDPAFVYDLSKEGDMSSWKTYKPLTKEKRFKWKSWNLTKIPGEGYYLLPKRGTNLIITSSRKDGMVLNKLNPNKYNRMNPTGESAWRNIITVKPELESRFRYIYILYDGDIAGRKAANKLVEETGWIPIYLTYPPKTKDLTEIVEEYGYNKLKRMIDENIKT